jgi:hypothetical protein
MDCGADPQLLVSVKNLPGLNGKFLHSVCVLKEYVLLTADVDVKLGGPFGAFSIRVGYNTILKFSLTSSPTLILFSRAISRVFIC